MFLPSLFRNQAFSCALTLSLLAAGSASAADGTWTGDTSVTWASAANWSNSIVPGGSAANSDKATFNSGSYTFAPTAANNYFIGGLIFGSSSGPITITTGTGNGRLNVGSDGIQVDASSGAVSLGSAATQGTSIVANQNWANNSSSLLTVNRVSVDDASLAGTYTLTINGSGSGGVNFSTDINDVNGNFDLTRLFALQVDSTGGNTTISSANKFTGGTTLTQGNLLLGNNTALGTGSLALNGGKISSSATGTQTPANNTTIGGNVTLGDAVNTGKLIFSGTMGLDGATRTLTTDSLVDFSGVVGNGGITKQGASALTFLGAGANTYTGLTTVSAGGLTLNKTAVDAIAGNVLVNGTGTLTLSAADQINDVSDVEVAAGTFALGGNTDTVNGVKLTGGAITGTGNNGILTSITAYDLQSGSSSAVLAGTAGATKTTAGTVALTKANTYSGGTTLSDGTLQLGNNSALGTGALALNGGTLSSGTVNNRTILNTTTIGGNVTLGDAANDGKLTFSAGVDLGAADRTLTTASNVDFDGAVSGNGGITKAGSATLTLGANNSYLGNTVLSQGSLIINGNQSSATGAFTVASGAMLGGSGTIGGATTISGIHSPGNSAGVQTFASNLTYIGTPTVEWELTGNTTTQASPTPVFDQIVVNGNLDFSVATTLTLNFAFAGSTVDWSNGLWGNDITGTSGWLVYDVTGNLSDFQNLSISVENWADGQGTLFGTVRAGSSFGLYNDGNDIYLNYAIPEPSTYALLALLGAAFAGRAMVRRRRRHGVD